MEPERRENDVSPMFAAKPSRAEPAPSMSGAIKGALAVVTPMEDNRPGADDEHDAILYAP
jgi:hypothetical protein